MTAARIVAMAVSCVAALVIAEWSVRLALPAYDPAAQVAWERHPVAGTVLGRPGSSGRQIKNSGDYDVAVGFNKYGFRDRQDVATGNRRDIYVVGDSFTFGWGLEEKERFSNVLTHLTGRRVFNLSASLNIDGYERLLAYAERLGAGIETVILGLNTIDDVRDYAPAASASVPDVAARPERRAAASGPLTLLSVKRFMLRHSALYFLVTNTVNEVAWLRRALIQLGLIRTIRQVSMGLPDAQAIATTADRLAELGGTYDLTILIIPSRGLWLGDARRETRDAHVRIRGALESRGLRVVDPLARLEQGGNPLHYHFRNDGHWNPAGHRLAAEALADALEGGG